MDILLITSVIYGLFLIGLSIKYSSYTLAEFSLLLYGVFFLALGLAIFLLSIGSGYTDVNAREAVLWTFAVAFLSSGVNLLFKSGIIKKRSPHIERII